MARLMDWQPSQTGNRSGTAQARLAHVRLGLYRRLRLIVALPILIGAIAACVAYTMPTRYLATAVLQIDPRQKSANDVAESPSETPQRTIEDEVDALQSDAVLEDAIDHLSPAATSYLNASGPRSLFDQIVRWRFEAKANAVATLRARLRVARVRSTQLVGIQYSAPDPGIAAQVSNAVADAYLREQIGGRWRLAVANTASAGPASTETASDRVFREMIAQNGLSLQLPGARVVSPADRTAVSIGPKRFRLIAAAAGASLTLSFGMALLLTFLARPDNAARIERALACPHLTSLPACTEPHAPIDVLSAMRRVVCDPQGHYAGAIGKACKALEHQRAETAPRTILVTSALADEDAEGVASNLAHYLAASGQTVLLIDADLRAKNLTQRLAGHCDRGLLDQIARHAPVEEAILQDGVTGLCFLPASGPAPIPLSIANVLKSAAFAGSIGALKMEFSTIVVAAPALLDAGDASAIAECADQIIFVTAAERTPSRTAADAVASLGSNQRKIVGAVLTDIESTDDRSVMSFRDLVTELQTLAVRAA